MKIENGSIMPASFEVLFRFYTRKTSNKGFFASVECNVTATGFRIIRHERQFN